MERDGGETRELEKESKRWRKHKKRETRSLKTNQNIQHASEDIVPSEESVSHGLV